MFEDSRTRGEFAPYIDVRDTRIDGETGDQDAFEQLMRVLVDDVAVLKSPGLGFIGVRDQVNRLLLIRLDKAPLHAAGKPGAATAAQARSLYFVDDVDPRHRHGFL